MDGHQNGKFPGAIPRSPQHDRPLLSIGIPTFNRATRLRVALEALLPQTKSCNEQVEVLVSDNASTDDTALVIEDFSRKFSIRSSRNQNNLGPVSNMIHLATKMACGEYVWILGDDDLVAPDAVQRVLDTIRAHQNLDVFYLNFRVARYPTHWPDHAYGGYSGPYESTANTDQSLHVQPRWEELVRPENWMATQVYCHVVRKKMWDEYWSDRVPGPTYSHARWTWPHSFMIAESMVGKNCIYVGDPVLTVFEGGQSWKNETARVVLLRIPELLAFYSHIGVPQDNIAEYRAAMFKSARIHLANILRGQTTDDDPSIQAYLAVNWRRSDAWLTLLGAITDARPKSPIGRVARLVGRLRRALLNQST